MMQQLTKPLRTCHVCGLEANTEAELKQFKKDKRYAYGYVNLCKKCNCEDTCERETRATEFIKIFKARSFDGIIRCYFCGAEIIKLSGHESRSLTIHSLDGNHENWNPVNKIPTHLSCHLRYHNTSERSLRWKGDEAQPTTIKRRDYVHQRLNKQRLIRENHLKDDQPFLDEAAAKYIG